MTGRSTLTGPRKQPRVNIAQHILRQNAYQDQRNSRKTLPCRARALGERIRSERGLDRAVEVIEQFA